MNLYLRKALPIILLAMSQASCFGIVSAQQVKQNTVHSQVVNKEKDVKLIFQDPAIEKGVRALINQPTGEIHSTKVQGMTKLLIFLILLD